MNSDIAIKVENVSKTFKIPHEKVTSLRGVAINLFRSGGYEEFQALDDVSFEVKKGEFFGIIGRNGSGKSTLLKILAGIYPADKGKVHIDGLISPFLELGIGFNPELSGRDNIYLNATVLGLTKKQIDAKFDSIIAFSELERFIDQKLKNYSSGMSVRLAFSVAIHANREILLMDEVLAVGDTNFQSKCLEEFKKYREMGKTVILVTHDVSVVQMYCDKVMLLREGKIFKLGKAKEVAETYINKNIFDEEQKKFEDDYDYDPKTEGSEIIKKSTKIKYESKNKKFVEIVNTDQDRFSYRIGNKKAIINGIALLDKNGIAKDSFEIKESMDVVIDLNCSGVAGDVFLGVSIYPENKKENVVSFEYKLDKNRKKIKISISELNLNERDYYLSIGITGTRENWTTPYDLLEKIIKFKVRKMQADIDGLINYSTCNIPFNITYEK
jgi:ABC-type polysaccharide/polyol phosphate transport system ATPase subunit